MNFKKLSAIAFVSAAILAGASVLEASPSWNAYSTSMSINEDCSDEVIAQVKEKFKSNKPNIKFVTFLYEGFRGENSSILIEYNSR